MTSDAEWQAQMEAWLAEPLHPDLEPHMTETTYGVPFLHHRLVVMPMPIPGHANALYRQKQRQVAEAYMAGNLQAVVWYYERAYRLDLVLEWMGMGVLDARTELCRTILMETYIDAEVIHHQVPELVEAFRAVGYCTDRFDGYVPNKPLQVWRGGDPEGMSWTRSFDTATWFAKRYNEPSPQRWAATVEPDGVLAILDGRNEEEVVVDPDWLGDVKEVPVA